MKDIVLKHALINALEHGGSADDKAVLGKVIAEDASLKGKIKEIIPEIKRIVNEVNSLAIEEQREKLRKLGATL